MAEHNADTQGDELILTFGVVDMNRLSATTRSIIMQLAAVLREEPGILRCQITFDDLHGDLAGHDDPPTMHAILTPDGNPEYWLRKDQR